MILPPSESSPTILHQKPQEYTARDDIAIRKERNKFIAEKNMDDTLKMIFEPA
jgi:hypothetical protein